MTKECVDYDNKNTGLKDMCTKMEECNDKGKVKTMTKYENF